MVCHKYKSKLVIDKAGPGYLGALTFIVDIWAKKPFLIFENLFLIYCRFLIKHEEIISA